MSSLPPCHSDLKSHVQRVNQRAALNKRADEPILAGKAVTLRWWAKVDKDCGHILSNSLADRMDRDDGEKEDEDELDFEDVHLSDGE